MRWVLGLPERAYYFTELYERIRRSPLLRDAVTSEPFSLAAGALLSVDELVLSTSQTEGHPVGLAEGMASAAVPVIWTRPGADHQYEPRWIHADADSAAVAVRAIHAHGEVDAEGSAARAFAMRWSLESVSDAWEQVLDLGGERTESRSGDEVLVEVE